MTLRDRIEKWRDRIADWIATTPRQDWKAQYDDMARLAHRFETEANRKDAQLETWQNAAIQASTDADVCSASWDQATACLRRIEAATRGVKSGTGRRVHRMVTEGLREE